MTGLLPFEWGLVAQFTMHSLCGLFVISAVYHLVLMARLPLFTELKLTVYASCTRPDQPVSMNLNMHL